MTRLIDAIHRRPTAAFIGFLALHGVVWTALPAIFFLNLPLDVIEGLLYGREWQLGHDKLPPLPWWMLAANDRLFGPDVFFYAMSQLAVIAAFVGVWALARRLVGPIAALVAVLIIDGLHYFTFTSPKFNHDLVQLPLWALACAAYWAALRRGRMIHWLVLGFAVGMALWAKYFVVVLAAPLMAFILLDREARATLRTPGPYVAAAVALAVASPHLIWLVQNNFLPFAYVDARAHHFTRAIDYLILPARFVLAQVGDFLPALLIAAPCLLLIRKPAAPDAVETDAFDRRIVTLFTFGPVTAVIVLSIVAGRDVVAMWGYPLWLFAGLWIVMHVPRPDPTTLWRIAFNWAVVFSVYVIAFVVHYAVRPRIQERYTAELYPGDRIAEEMSRRFREMTGQPLTYVIGSMWHGGNIGRYGPTHARTLIDGKPARAPWIDLDDLRRHGAVVVWTLKESPNYMPRFFQPIADDAEVQRPITLPGRIGKDKVTFGWALLRPVPPGTPVKPPLGQPKPVPR
jgi:hypothetical protein